MTGTSRDVAVIVEVGGERVAATKARAGDFTARHEEQRGSSGARTGRAGSTAC